ncbi:MAG: lyase family protein [Paracoccaceae bacterium]|nr:lyase family protein [Paracoccaceae bacterium]
MSNMFDNIFLGGVYSDPEVTSILSNETCLMAIIQFETSLAKVEGNIGVIPKTSARSIQRALKRIKSTDIASTYVTEDGIIIPQLIGDIKKKFLSEEDSDYLHWGVTSQDAIDTARCIQLKDFLWVIESRLKSVLQLGAEKALAYKYLPIASRTRGQMASITSLGAKLAANFFPILNQRIRLSKLKPNILQLSLGGSSGTSNCFGGKYEILVKELAKDLNLTVPIISWHNNRETFVELASILTIITSCFGKFGADIFWMHQSELQEIELNSVGRSSVMLHKKNPILPEALMALADINNALISSMNSTMVHRNERDGVAWTKEIIVLKQIMYCTGIASKIGLNLLKIANPRRDNIDRNLERSNGLIFAETAVNYLSNFYNKRDAKRIVSEGIKNVETSNSTLLVELEKITENRVDFSEVFDSMKNLGQAPEIVGVFCDQVNHQNF